MEADEEQPRLPVSVLAEEAHDHEHIQTTEQTAVPTVELTAEQTAEPTAEPVAEPSELDKLLARVDSLLLRYLGSFVGTEKTDAETLAKVNRDILRWHMKKLRLLNRNELRRRKDVLAYIGLNVDE